MVRLFWNQDHIIWKRNYQLKPLNCFLKNYTLRVITLFLKKCYNLESTFVPPWKSMPRRMHSRAEQNKFWEDASPCLTPCSIWTLTCSSNSKSFASVVHPFLGFWHSLGKVQMCLVHLTLHHVQLCQIPFFNEEETQFAAVFSAPVNQLRDYMMDVVNSWESCAKSCLFASVFVDELGCCSI